MNQCWRARIIILMASLNAAVLAALSDLEKVRAGINRRGEGPQGGANRMFIATHGIKFLLQKNSPSWRLNDRPLFRPFATALPRYARSLWASRERTFPFTAQ